MADTGIVLDLDAKFLKNLEQANKSLTKSIQHSKDLTRQFTKLVQGTNSFSEQVRQLTTMMDRIGGGQLIKAENGMLKIEQGARTASDAVELLEGNISKLTEKYRKFASENSFGKKNSGTSLRIIDEQDLKNIPKLRAAIASINASLNSKSRKKPLSLVDINQLNEQKAIYLAALRELRKTDNQRVSEQEKNAKRVIKNLNAEAKAVKSVVDAYFTKTPTRSMSFAGSAKTLEELKRAYKYLIAVRDKINPDTKQGQKQLEKLNNAISETKAKMDDLANSDSPSKIETAIKQAFSIRAIYGFIQQLTNVRGEFELQQRSLQILLRSRSEANRLWGQVTDLAVKSPFSVAQLVTATKQLAAYRVESSKLYSTTKMLADISSGLGVEMNRLILAFGQVKAASFLRGTELRQFTEAGVNMLDELSRYYTDLEGKTVTVSQVFDRISKRMVSFRDVENVLQSLTSTGGLFYDMQEQQADTLKGMIRNLTDSAHLMFNEVGEASDGVIKSIVATLKWLTDNWETFATILKLSIPLWLGHATAATRFGRVINTVLSRSTTSAIKFSNILKILGLGIRGLASSVKTLLASMGPLGWVIAGLTAVGGLLMKVYNHISGSHLDEIRDRMRRVADEIDDINVNFQIAVNEGDINKQKDALRKLLDAAEKDLALKITPTIDIDSETSRARLADEYQRVRSFIDSQKNVSYSISSSIKNESQWVGLVDDIYDDTEEYANAASEFYQNFLSMRADMITVFTESGRDLTDAEEKLLSDLIRLEKNVAETEAQHLARIRDFMGHYDMRGLAAEDMEDLADSLKSSWESFTSDLEEVEQEYLSAWEGLDFSRIPEEDRRLMIEAALDTDESLQEYNSFVQFMLRDLASRRFGYTITPNTDDSEVALEQWMLNFNEVVSKYKGDISFGGIFELSGSETLEDVKGIVEAELRSVTDLISQIDAAYKEYGADRTLWPKVLHESLSDPNIEKNARALANVIKNELYPVIGLIFQDEKNGGSGKEEDKFIGLTRTITDAYKAFEKLSDKFDKELAVSYLWVEYGDVIDDAFKKVGKSAEWVREQFNDLSSEQDLRNAMQWIADNATTAEAKTAALRAIAKIELDYQIDTRDASFKRMSEEVEDLFSGYELSIELDKLRVPKSFASDLFNVDALSLEELRSSLMSMKDAFDDMGNEGVRAYEEYLDRIDELEIKAQQDRLKKYIEYTREAVSQRAKIMIDGFNEVVDIERTFTLTNSMALNRGLITDEQKRTLEETGETISSLLKLSTEDLLTWGLTSEQIDNLREANDLLREQGYLAIEASRARTEQAQMELDWKSFKESTVFAQVFSDLESASDSLISLALDKLREFKDAWKDLDLNEYSEILDLIRKLEGELAQSTPIRSYTESRRGIIDAMAGRGDYAIDFQSQQAANMAAGLGEGFVSAVDYDKYREALEVELAYRQDIVDLMERELAAAEATYDELVRSASASDAEIAAAKNGVDLAKKSLSTAKDQRNVVEDTLQLDKNRRSAIKETGEKIKDSVATANKLYDAFKGLAETFVEDDSLGMMFADMGMEMINMVANTVLMNLELFNATMAAHGFGAALKAAMGPIGWILLAIQALTMALTAAFKAHDKAIENDIEHQRDKLKMLEKEYRNLEDSMDRVYEAAEIERLTNAMVRNLNAQIQSMHAMVALEHQKKKTDDDKISDLEDDIEDRLKSIKDVIEDAFSTATDGILDDVLDATRGFVDAWYDAYSETKNGMSGLKDTFNDMLTSMLKQQASMQLISPFINKYKDWLKNYVDVESGDSELTADEARAWANRVKDTLPQVNDLLENFFEGTQGLLATSGELSGLSKGIQGITEEQADLLAAYWNSCRFMLSNIDTTLTRISGAVFDTSGNSNPILSELRAQTEIIQSIRTMFDSVIGSGGDTVHSGAYLKVYM